MLGMLLTLLKGIMIGVCNVIPGVSGGTLVVIFDIYDQFMDITSLNFKKIIKNWRFTVPLLLGMLAGILIFSKVITYLFTNFPTQTYYFFTGLIVGSIPLLYKYTFKTDKDTKKSAGLIISLIVCVAIGIAVIIGFKFLQDAFGGTEFVNQELPAFTIPLALKIFVAGILGAVAMIIPGISGALLMLIMGVYPIIIAAISKIFEPASFFHAVSLLTPNGLGILIGLVAGSNLLKFLLRKFPRHTYAVILGLIAGSIINIFPGFSCIKTVGCGIGSVISFLIAAAMAYFSSKISPDEGSKKSEEKNGEAASTETASDSESENS